jgi:2',3'-cyclic-nucleotide 2'-phosphodiesterase (5'-nucleotidase family)
MRNFITIFFLLVVLTACHKSVRVVESNSEVITIDSTFDSIQDTTYLLHITPIKDMLKKQLDMPIGYAPKTLPVYQPECPMLNWASDALFTVTKQLYPKQVDMAVVNIGGMRCEWASGDITFRNVFELMPFDNELVVLTLSGKDILALCDIFAKHGGEGVAGLRMVAKNGVLKSVTIAGKEVIPEVYYTIATSDYLSQVLNYIVFIGAIGLTIIAIVPIFFSGVFGASVSFAGTSLIIVVGVIIETLKQIESQMRVRYYKGFLND